MAGTQAGFSLLSLSLGCLHPPICCTTGSCMGWKCILSRPPTEGPVIPPHAEGTVQPPFWEQSQGPSAPASRKPRGGKRSFFPASGLTSLGCASCKRSTCHSALLKGLNVGGWGASVAGEHP